MIGGTGKTFLRALVATAAAALGCAGATTQSYCPTAPATGGDIHGTWTVDKSHGSLCMAPYDATTSGDWCSQLVYDAGGIRQLSLGHPDLAFTSGTATFMGDAGSTSGAYTSDLKFDG